MTASPGPAGAAGHRAMSGRSSRRNPVESVVEGPATATSRDGFMYCLLGLAAIRPMSAYDVQRALRTSIGYLWGAAESQVYTALARLEQGGLLQSAEELNGRRSRKVYRLTDGGQEELDAWLRTTSPPRAEKDDFLLKLFFMGDADDQDAIRHLHDRRAHLTQVLTQCRNMLDAYGNKQLGPRQRILDYQLLTLRIKVAQLEHEMGLIDECIRLIQLGELHSVTEPSFGVDPTVWHP